MAANEFYLGPAGPSKTGESSNGDCLNLWIGSGRFTELITFRKGKKRSVEVLGYQKFTAFRPWIEKGKTYLYKAITESEARPIVLALAQDCLHILGRRQ